MLTNAYIQYAAWTKIELWENCRVTLACDAAHPMCPCKSRWIYILNKAPSYRAELIKLVFLDQSVAKAWIMHSRMPACSLTPWLRSRKAARILLAPWERMIMKFTHGVRTKLRCPGSPCTVCITTRWWRGLLSIDMDWRNSKQYKGHVTVIYVTIFRVKLGSSRNLKRLIM